MLRPVDPRAIALNPLQRPQCSTTATGAQSFSRSSNAGEGFPSGLASRCRSLGLSTRENGEGVRSQQLEAGATLKAELACRPRKLHRSRGPGSPGPHNRVCWLTADRDAWSEKTSPGRQDRAAFRVRQCEDRPSRLYSLIKKPGSSGAHASGLDDRIVLAPIKGQPDSRLERSNRR